MNGSGKLLILAHINSSHLFGSAIMGVPLYLDISNNNQYMVLTFYHLFQKISS